MRLTHKKLRLIVQELLNKLEIKLIVANYYTTRYTSDQYEGNASKINILANDGVDTSNNLTILCSYSIKELEWYFNNGYRLILRTPYTDRLISDWEIEVTNK